MRNSGIAAAIAVLLFLGFVLFMPGSSNTITAQCSSCPNTCDAAEGHGEYPSDFCRWPNTGCAVGDGEDNGGCCCPLSPILIDLEGDGFALTDAAHGVFFDINNDGKSEHVSWTNLGTNDGWLVLDRNSNGIIDNGAEMFGNFTQQTPKTGIRPNGFLALAEFDKTENGGTNDSSIDRDDAIFSQLRVWVDTNHDGVSEPNELLDLPSAGVVSISLDYREVRKRDAFGNIFGYAAKVNRDSDKGPSEVGRWAYDVLLLRDRTTKSQ